MKSRIFDIQIVSYWSSWRTWPPPVLWRIPVFHSRSTMQIAHVDNNNNNNNKQPCPPLVARRISIAPSCSKRHPRHRRRRPRRRRRLRKYGVSCQSRRGSNHQRSLLLQDPPRTLSTLFYKRWSSYMMVSGQLRPRTHQRAPLFF